MNPEDPEKYIRDLERKAMRDLERAGGQTPGAAPQPSSTDSGSPPATPPSAPPAPPSDSPVGTWNSEQFGSPGGWPVPGRTSRRRFGGVAKLANAAPKRLLLVFAVASLIAIGAFLWNQNSTTKVQGNMIMMNSGWKGKIDCNNGTLKLDGDNNTYTITGHCLRLEVFGSANKVTVDSADTISVIGDDNAVAYHSGSPTINKTGANDIVSQTPSTR
jgi:hypothetical protein